MSDPLDLTQCDREPIHVPGSIQPHGTLFTVSPDDLSVLQFAGTWKGWDSRAGHGPVGMALEEVLGQEVAARLKAATLTDTTEPTFIGSFAFGDASNHCDVLAHISGGNIVVEVEPAELSHKSAPEILSTIRAIISRFETAEDLAELCSLAARLFQEITKFDRVMVYRFHDDGVGYVFAEDKRADLPSFLNHHYPASDIPSQARALYVRNRVRTIPDVHYEPLPLHPVALPSGEPLDMSDSVLRSVSPIHVQYLKNMGVSASASVSIVVQGELWGLIAFHHLGPKRLGYELREACKHLAQVLAQHIRARESSEARDQAAELAAKRDELAKELSDAERLDSALLARCASVAQLVPCDGAAVLCGDRLAKAGIVPSAEITKALAEWVIDNNLSRPFATAHLSGCPGYPLAPMEEAAGLLAAVVSAEDRVAVLWFRAEQIKKIEWAGNPHKPTEPGEEAGTLNPRKSFAVWAEIVRNRSHPWSKAEEDTARRFGRLVEGLRQQEMLRGLVSRNEQLLAQKDLLMQEADHRIQNNIQLIHSMLGLQAREIPSETLRAQIEETQRRLMAVSMMHRQLWRSGELHGVDLGKYLTELRDGLVASWGAGWSEHLKINAASIIIPANRAVTLALVVNEVLTNAVKYAYQGQQGPIEIALTEQDDDGLRIDIADRGVGWQGDGNQGFGSRLTRSLMSQLHGEMEITSNSPGTRVILRVKRSEATEGERLRK